jgi:hypothetical protein
MHRVGILTDERTVIASPTLPLHRRGATARVMIVFVEHVLNRGPPTTTVLATIRVPVAGQRKPGESNNDRGHISREYPTETGRDDGDNQGYLNFMIFSALHIHDLSPPRI